MAPRAEWGKGGYTLDRGELLREHLRTCWAEALVLLFFFGLAALCGRPNKYSPEGDLSAVLGFATIGLVLVLTVSAVRWPSTKRRALRKRCSEGTMASFELTIKRDGVLLGKDQCVAWFADGRMRLVGVRICFDISGSDVDWSKCLDPNDRYEYRNVLLLTPTHGDVVLLFSHIQVSKFGKVQESEAWFYEGKAQLRSQQPQSVGEASPPLTIDPQTLRGPLATLHVPETTSALLVTPIFLWNILGGLFSDTIDRVGGVVLFSVSVFLFVQLTRRSVERVARTQQVWNQARNRGVAT